MTRMVEAIRSTRPSDAIATAADAGHATVACIGKATRAGTGCGGCRERIAQVLERQALSTSSI
jgi:assimilatory nitrate reductase electron transfer subunit